METFIQNLSADLLLDLTSQFLTKLLEKDPNSYHYMKQWDSFRQLLSNKPLSLTGVFSYIANFKEENNTYPITTRPPPLNTEFQTRFYDDSPETINFQRNVSFEPLGKPLKSQETLRRRAHSSYNQDDYNQQQRSFEIGKNVRYRPSQFAKNHYNEDLFDSPSNNLNQSPFLPHDVLSEVSTGVSLDNGGFSDSPNYRAQSRERSNRSKDIVNFLADFSRRFKNSVENNNEALRSVCSMHGHARNQYNKEERSPLRKMRLYDKQESIASDYRLNHQISDFSLGKNLIPASYSNRLNFY